MKRNPILYVLLAILIAQPLLIVGFGPSTTATILQSDDVSVLSQGTRLDPGDHTDHVPIFINGTGDFIAQGWPGSGTSGDPYVIAGLNITYDLGLVGIWIINTDAYFVIRDCYIDQNSALYAIHLEDTSHAKLEYVTVSSESTAIYGLNAVNTELLHVDSTGRSSNRYALQLVESHGSTLQSSYMESVDYRGVLIYNSSGVVFSDNIVDPIDSYYGIYVWYSSDFESTDDTVLPGHTGIRYDNSNNSITTRLTTETQWGVNIIDSFGGTVQDCQITTTVFDGMYISNSPNVDVMNNVFNLERRGIWNLNSNGTYLFNNEFVGASEAGLYIDSSYFVEIVGNDISDGTTEGIYITSSGNSTIDGNTLTSHGTGIEGDATDFVTLLNNVVTDNTANGIYLTDCDSWEISENEITDCGNVGIGFNGGAFADVWYNVITNTDDIGLYVNTHGMFEAWENTMTETDGGIYVTGSHETYIRDNDVFSSTAYGMYIHNSENHTIDDNSFYDCATMGIELDDCDTSSFSGNQIFSGPLFGFYLSTSEYNTFSGNLLTDCGFYFEEGSPLSMYNHTLTGNEVNALPVLYSIDAAGGSYSGASYGQLIFVACNDTTITGGTFDRATVPILLYHSLRTTIDGVTLLNSFFGILNEVSDNTTIIDSVLDYCDYGAFVRDSMFVSISNTDFSNGISAVDTYDVSFMTISDSTFTNMADSGFYTQTYALNCSIVDSHFYNISGSAVRSQGNSDYWNITNNLFEHCGYAFFATGTSGDYGVLIGNEIYYSSNVGIYLSDGDFFDIQNNTILWSGTHGLWISDNAWIQAGWQICYNTIGLSGTNNAYDTRAANVWDDEVDTGNWWSDYSGTGTYSISGAGAVDNYPMQFIPTEPIIDAPMDVWYAEGTTGNEISWMPYDNYLKNYIVTIGGASWEVDAVPAIVTPTITVNIDGLSYGVHTLVITVYDIDLNSVSDTVTINVFDDIDPTINNPPNFEIFFGVTGNEIIWEADDLHPGDYVVMMDDSEYATGSWTSGDVSLNLDGLSVGAHHFTMTVYDLDGNSVYDSVSILVINDAVGPTIDSPDDIVFVVESTGNRIIWTPVDDYPDSFDIEFNETIVLSGDWSGGRVILDLDNLEVGEYNFTITVWDGGQQSATDMVAVQVIPYEGWTPTLTPPDFTLLIIAGVGIAGAVVVIGVIYFLKFKKPSSGGA